MSEKQKGRKQNIHMPVPATFDEVLGAIAHSKYTDAKTIKKTISKKKKK